MRSRRFTSGEGEREIAISFLFALPFLRPEPTRGKEERRLTIAHIPKEVMPSLLLVAPDSSRKVERRLDGAERTKSTRRSQRVFYRRRREGTMTIDSLPDRNPLRTQSEHQSTRENEHDSNEEADGVSSSKRSSRFPGR